jgi:short-subunit dehydrogenase
VDVNRKRVLLTGATGGLGRAIAERLSDRGATMVLSSRKAEELTELAASLPGDGHKAVVADLALEGSAERLVSEAGQVDILVANAGLPGTGKLANFSEQDVARAVTVNLEAPMRMARLLVADMLEREEGHLVFVSSLSGKAPSPSSSVYNATKFGLRGFAFGLRCDLAGTGVGVSVVSPGFVRDAGMFADADMKAPGGMGTTTPAAVASGVERAIRRDKPEVAVATRRLRVLSHFGLANPSMAIRVASGRAGQRAASTLAEQQTDKR